MATFEHISFQQLGESDLIDFLELSHHDKAKSLLELMRRNFHSARISNPKYKSLIQDITCLLEQIEVQIKALFSLEAGSLFPFVRKLAEVSTYREPVRFLRVSLIESSIRRITEEHSHITALLHSTRQLSNNFRPPADSTEILKLGFAELREFEELVSNQLFREQNILFPKILQLEDEILHKSSIAATGTGAKGHDE